MTETERYTERVLDRKGRDLDADGRALLEEDLRSPCTEEVAVFHAFSRLVSEVRANIEPFAWVIDASLAGSGTSDPLLRQRTESELTQIARVRRDYATRVAIVPWQSEPPIGVASLSAIGRKRDFFTQPK